ncbi:MAG TPA: hypothetical protein DCR93_24040, partial [Cytophagales bacterium]|nr:hypothetical protein [Cytophagales bacterium]
HITSVYWEYGLTDKLGVVAYVPFFNRSTLNEVVRPDGELVQSGDELNGFGDPEVRVKYSLYREGPWAVAASIGLGLPLGNPAGGSTQLLQTGDGEFNQKLLVEASRSFKGGNGYATATVGFNNRTQGFSEEFIYGVEGGIKAGSLWLIGKVNGLESFKNGAEDLSVNNGIFSNNLEYLVVSPAIAWQVGKSWGVTADAGFALRGERILADPSYSVGVYLDL